MSESTVLYGAIAVLAGGAVPFLFRALMQALTQRAERAETRERKLEDQLLPSVEELKKSMELLAENRHGDRETYQRMMGSLEKIEGALKDFRKEEDAS